MGFWTTISFSNDATQNFKEHPEEVAKLIDDALHGIQIDEGRDYDGVGNHANPVVIQKSRHADDHTLYLHAGNTITDVYNADSDWSIDQFIHEMEYHLKRLKEIKKGKTEKMKLTS